MEYIHLEKGKLPSEWSLEKYFFHLLLYHFPWPTGLLQCTIMPSIREDKEVCLPTLFSFCFSKLTLKQWRHYSDSLTLSNKLTTSFVWEQKLTFPWFASRTWATAPATAPPYNKTYTDKCKAFHQTVQLIKSLLQITWEAQFSSNLHPVISKYQCIIIRFSKKKLSTLMTSHLLLKYYKFKSKMTL